MDEILIKVSNRCESYRLKGYHCSESTLRACADILNLDIPEVLYKVSSGFRGGGGGYGERCGVVEAGILLISFLYGRIDPNEDIAKYSQLICILHDRFLAELGSYTCRVLMPFAKHISPDQSCSYVYKKGAMVVARLLLESEGLLAELQLKK
jgi:C_GCAxxG_C_C family probable redox protein